MDVRKSATFRPLRWIRWARFGIIASLSVRADSRVCKPVVKARISQALPCGIRGLPTMVGGQAGFGPTVL